MKIKQSTCFAIQYEHDCFVVLYVEFYRDDGRHRRVSNRWTPVFPIHARLKYYRVYLPKCDAMTSYCKIFFTIFGLYK
jgi:hypothetical protein